jgi:dTDP-4-dehydrorhamnose 3,5-epimerase
MAMTFTATEIPDVLIVMGDTFADERGTLEVLWRRDEADARGFDVPVTQCNLACSTRRGTIRGMHFQTPPVEQAKLIRTIRGSVFDVVVDLRRDSPTYRRWVGVELHDSSRTMLYVPSGFAHGYQTLTDNAEVLYVVSAPYAPAHQGGVRWNDAAFGIKWPLGAPTAINARDASFPDFT